MPGLNAATPATVSDLSPAALVPGEHAPAPDNARIVVFVVDGLREDHVSALELGSPSGERHPTARCVATVNVPSYSRTAYASLGTGAPPRLTGVKTNSHRGAVKLDSIFSLAQRIGIRVELITDGIDWWRDLYPGVWDAHTTQAETFETTLAQLWRDDSEAQLTLVHAVAADKAAHDDGVGERYEAALNTIGIQIRALFDRLDPQRDTILVISDHGHIARGGHGGNEQEVITIPLIALGRGISPGEDTCQKAHINDIAPTVAALMGAPPPTQSLGRPLVELLDFSAESLDQITRRSLAQREQVEACLAQNKTEAPDAAQGRLSLFPLLIALLIWLGLSVTLVWVTASAKHLRNPRLWFVALSYPATFAGLYVGTEPGLSLSAVWDRDPWLVKMVIYAAGAALGRWTISRLVLDWSKAHQTLAMWVATASVCLLGPSISIGCSGALLGNPSDDLMLSYVVLLTDLVALTGCTLLIAEIIGTSAIRHWRRPRAMAGSTSKSHGPRQDN